MTHILSRNRERSQMVRINHYAIIELSDAYLILQAFSISTKKPERLFQ